MEVRKGDKKCSNEKEKGKENGTIDSCHGDDHTLC